MIAQPELKVGLIIANLDLRNEVHAALQGSPVRIVVDQSGIRDWAQLLDQLEQFRPEVVLIDLSQLEQAFDEPLRRLKSTTAAPTVIALNTSADPETILDAIRAGASEYLYPPLAAGLRKALVRMAADRMQRRQGSRGQGKLLGFFSAKGGCGATTVICHVASELQRLTGKDILLADLDMETGMLGFLMKAKTPYSILDAAKNIHKLDMSYWKALVSNGQPGLEVITAPGVLGLRDSLQPEQLRHVLRFTRSVYDWVLADLGRSLNVLSLSVLEDMDQAFLVVTLDVLALHRAKQVVQTLLDLGYSRQRLHLVLNRMPRQPDLTPAEVQKVLGLPIYAALPNSYPELYEAYSEGNLLSTATDLGRHLSKLAQKIAGVQEEREKEKEKDKSRSKLSIFF
ncbi:MAG: AAA family ATPase [Acidobacteriota bacterium]